MPSSRNVHVELPITCRLGSAAPTFPLMESSAVNFDAALQNGKPTIAEFYANWCTVCKELLPTSYDIEQKYLGQINFSMLNVDNPKWGPEVSEYGVTGVPEFLFFNAQGEAVVCSATSLQTCP
jgi:thiol-disulfide isomerase/thioredoxin